MDPQESIGHRHTDLDQLVAEPDVGAAMDALGPSYQVGGKRNPLPPGTFSSTVGAIGTGYPLVRGQIRTKPVDQAADQETE